MPYAIEWLVPQHVIESKFIKIFTVEELATYDTAVIEMFATSSAKQVHIISDVSKIEQFPSLNHASQMKIIQDERCGWVVVTGSSNPLLKTIALIIAKIFGNRLHWCNTREDALAFLRRMDDTLPENIKKS